MRKLIYISFNDYIDKSDGVNKKINSHINYFQRNNFEVTFISRYENGLRVNYDEKHHKDIQGFRTPLRKMLCDSVNDLLEKDNYDSCYMRFQFFCPHVFKMLKLLKAKNIKTIIEIPTFPYDYELIKQGVRGLPKLISDKLYRMRIKKYVERIVTYSDDEQIFGIKTIKTINGIDFSKVKISNYSNNKGGINLIAVATMAPWHGYDRLINGLNEHYKSGHKQNVYLHLVGDGIAINQYKNIVEMNGLNDFVIFHGKKSGDSLDELYDLCSIGVSSLGLHRINIKTASTLKSREYASRGLAIITANSLDFLDNASPYVLKLPSNENSIKIDRIVNFHKTLFLSTNDDIVKKKIREIAQKSCDINITHKKILSFLQSSFRDD